MVARKIYMYTYIERVINLYSKIDKMIYSKPDEYTDCDVKREYIYCDIV